MTYASSAFFKTGKKRKNIARFPLHCIRSLHCIRAVLEDKWISQTWLAKKLGRSFSTINAYVCNRSQPNLTTLLEIAQLLSVDMKELITDEKERND